MLTPHPEQDKINATARGMAHWSGTGPAGELCHTCAWWLALSETKAKRGKGGLTANKRSSTGKLKPRRCRLYAKMAQGNQINTGVPADTPACKYYDRQIEPPPPVLEIPRIRVSVRRPHKP